jgi:hypothetical protein
LINRFLTVSLTKVRTFFSLLHLPLLYNVLKSSGTSPNFLMTFASPKFPVAGSPVRLNATAPTCPGLRDSFRPHDDRSWIETFGWFTGRYAIVGSDEGQRHEVGYFGHGLLLAGIGLKSSPHKGVGHSLHQFADLGFQIFIRDNQRTDGRPHVAPARRNGLIDRSLQFVSVLCVRL